MIFTKHLVGKQGEAAAAAYLKQHGYRIVEQNFRIRGGEIDTVAKQGETLVFVEVKTRHSAAYGLPEEAITAPKTNYLKRAIAV